MITAIILIKTEQGKAPDVAQKLIETEGIAEAYSVAGQYDLVAIARVGHHEHLAELIADGVQRLPGIASTNTLIAFKAYSRRDLEAMWDTGNEERL